jgi:hypothetical protein
MAMRRALIIFASVVFIAVFIAVVADAAALSSFVVLAIAWLVAIVLITGGIIMRLRRSRAVVRAALERAGYDVLKMNYRYLRFGPFFSLWNTSRAQDVYRVLVRERSTGADQTVWARWGRTWFTAPQKLEFRCEDPATEARLDAEIGRREHARNSGSLEPRSTGLAVALAFVLLAPGEIAGHVVALFYRWAMAHFVGERSLDDSIGGWASVFLVDGFSGIIQGTVAGAIVIYICARAVKRADYVLVTYVNAAIVIGFTTLALAIPFVADGLKGLGAQHLGMAANAVGLVSALFLTARGIGARQHLNSFPVQP